MYQTLKTATPTDWLACIMGAAIIIAGVLA
jgi:hypothetical protein